MPGFLVLLVFGGMVPLVGLLSRLAVLMLASGLFSVELLVKLCSFLASLHWPSTVDDLGVGGVSLVELLILNER